MVMLCYALTLVVLAMIGHHYGLGGVFYTALLLTTAIAGYHYTLIRERLPARCFAAFRHNNWFGATIFVGIAGDHLFREYFK